MLKRKQTPKGRTDFTKLRALSEAEIERLANEDKDNPPDDDWARAVVGVPSLKVPVNAKFDGDVVAWFKAQGRGYQTRMNAVLRHYMETHRKLG